MPEKERGDENPLFDLRLFEPKSNDLRLDYPELAEVPEFKDMSPSDLKFVWYVSNRTSPIINLDKSERWREAAILAYGKNAVSSRNDVKDIIEGKMPDHIKDAINVMVKYNPIFRLRARFIAEYSFDQIQQLLFVSQDHMAMMDGDMKKKYTDFVFNANKELPKLIEQLERGYGVSIKNKKKEELNYKSVASIKDITQELE